MEEEKPAVSAGWSMRGEKCHVPVANICFGSASQVISPNSAHCKFRLAILTLLSIRRYRPWRVGGSTVGTSLFQGLPLMTLTRQCSDTRERSHYVALALLVISAKHLVHMIRQRGAIKGRKTAAGTGGGPRSRRRRERRDRPYQTPLACRNRAGTQQAVPGTIFTTPEEVYPCMGPAVERACIKFVKKGRRRVRRPWLAGRA